MSFVKYQSTMERRKKLFRPLSTRKKRFLDLEIFFKLAHFYNSLIDLCQFIAKTTTFWYKKYFFSQWSTLEIISPNENITWWKKCQHVWTEPHADATADRCSSPSSTPSFSSAGEIIRRINLVVKINLTAYRCAR